MAIRTYLELQALLADNSSGGIGASDIRDIVDSCGTDFARISRSDGNEVGELQFFNNSNTWTTMNCWSGYSKGSSNDLVIDTTQEGNGVDSYGLLSAGLYTVIAYIDLDTDGLDANESVEIGLFTAPTNDVNINNWTRYGLVDIATNTAGKTDTSGIMRIESEITVTSPVWMRPLLRRSQGTGGVNAKDPYFTIKRLPVVKGS